jgi:hypothetical protein
MKSPSANALNADALPALSERLRRRGYVFVALAEALEDPAYAHADGCHGGAGISLLHHHASISVAQARLLAGAAITHPMGVTQTAPDALGLRHAGREQTA